MKFLRNAEYDALIGQIDAQQARLDELEPYAPYLGWAAMLSQSLQEEMENGGLLTTDQLIKAAEERVSESHRDDAVAELIVEFEEDHRAKLYRAIVDQVREEEGDDILAGVQRRVDTDPELKVNLITSARNEVATSAIDQIGSQISEEQRVVIEKEADRQLELDRLDVEFAVDGEIDLFREDIVRLLQPGDRLELKYGDDADTSRSITVEWTKDVNQDQAWTYAKKVGNLWRRNGTATSLDSGQFIYPGSVHRDLSKRRDVNQPNVLCKGRSLILQTESKGAYSTIDARTRSTSGRNTNYDDLTLQSIDFRTKALHFNC